MDVARVGCRNHVQHQRRVGRRRVGRRHLLQPAALEPDGGGGPQRLEPGPSRAGARVIALDGRVRHFERHMERLAEGGRRLGMPVPDPDLIAAECERALTFAAYRVKRTGGTVVLITHKLHDVRACADRVAVMRAGRVVAQVEAGHMDDAQIVEVITHVGMNFLTNVLGKASQVEIDFPKVDLKLAA